jgi:hypothetical protein
MSDVVDFPVSPEERQRRLMVEVHRLAGLATVDWTYQLQHRPSISPNVLASHPPK